MKVFFITGTDTDIGKTFCTAGIACAAVKAGYITAVMKPVQTGISVYPSDISVIQKCVPGLYPLPEALACPYIFKFPASPHLAASVEKTEIQPEKIIQAYQRIAACNKKIDLLLIEGAGGVLVPIREDFLTVDLIKHLNVPVIVVSSLKLGTINHTLLTIETLKKNNIHIAGIIMNRKPGPTLSSGRHACKSLIEEDNIRIIEKISKVPVTGVIPEKYGFRNCFTEDLLKNFSQVIKQLNISQILGKK